MRQDDGRAWGARPVRHPRLPVDVVAPGALEVPVLVRHGEGAYATIARVRRLTIAVAVMALLALALVACGGASGGVPAATTETASTADTTGTATSSVPSAETSAAAGWTTYGGSASRSGIAPGTPANPNLRRRFARSLDADVYAQPLIAGGRIYVATEN